MREGRARRASELRVGRRRRCAPQAGRRAGWSAPRTGSECAQSAITTLLSLSLFPAPMAVSLKDATKLLEVFKVRGQEARRASVGRADGAAQACGDARAAGRCASARLIARLYCATRVRGRWAPRPTPSLRFPGGRQEEGRRRSAQGPGGTPGQ